jgi:hypothetical protein
MTTATTMPRRQSLFLLVDWSVNRLVSVHLDEASARLAVANTMADLMIYEIEAAIVEQARAA